MELGITGKTMLNGFLGAAAKENPDLKPIVDWLSKVKVNTTGKTASLTIPISMQDIEKLNLDFIKKMQGGSDEDDN
jgi:hypothetical protein